MFSLVFLRFPRVILLFPLSIPPPFPILDFSINHQLLIARLPAYSFHIESLEFISSYLKKKNSSAGIYLLKINDRNTRTICEICSKLTKKTPERCQWPMTLFFELVLHLNLLFLLLTLNT